MWLVPVSPGSAATHGCAMSLFELSGIRLGVAISGFTGARRAAPHYTTILQVQN
jgi:hypothetical protein